MQTASSLPSLGSLPSNVPDLASLERNSSGVFPQQGSMKHEGEQPWGATSAAAARPFPPPSPAQVAESAPPPASAPSLSGARAWWRTSFNREGCTNFRVYVCVYGERAQAAIKIP